MIRRKLFNPLKEHLKKREITVVVGPRQAGKTTLLMLLLNHLEENHQKTIFFNLDIERDKQFFVSQETLLGKIRLEFGKEGGTVFIDEIQHKENAGLFLKGLYDMNLPYKFVVSGSGSLELKEQIHESLAGRKRLFELSTISFEEWVHFKTEYRYESNLSAFLELDKIKVKTLLEEYLKFGGYPNVVLAETFEEKSRIMDEIYQSYLIRDIAYFLGVKQTESFSHLVKVLASQVGNLVNFAELSRTIGISHPTVKQYVYYLEKTFILRRLTPFFKNTRKEIVKAPIFYFNDLGMRNYALGILGRPPLIEGGSIFENFIFNLLKEKILFSDKELHFWRTKDGAEVDFVLTEGEEITPIEVKCMSLKKEIIPKSLRRFMEQFSPQKAWLINLDFNKKISIEGVEVEMKSFDRLM